MPQDNYLKELREKVGNRPLILAGAAALMVDDQNRVLLIRRTDNHRWGLPGER
jgi:ADP-ribose pyrophosphatase YjhB (NUDIX family)